MTTAIRQIPRMVAAATLTTMMPVGAALYVDHIWKDTSESWCYKISTLPFQILGGAVFSPQIIASRIDEMAQRRLKNK